MIARRRSRGCGTHDVDVGLLLLSYIPLSLPVMKSKYEEGVHKYSQFIIIPKKVPVSEGDVKVLIPFLIQFLLKEKYLI